MPDGLDPTISLQAGRNIPTFGPDMGQVLSLARLGAMVQQQQQQQQSLAALRQAYANPQNFVGGMPTMAAISQAGQQSPAAAMELQRFGETGARSQYLQQQLQHIKEQMALDHNKEAMGIQDKAQEIYETRVNVDKWPEPEARAAAQRYYTDQFQSLFSTGAMPASQARMIPPNFDPAANAQSIARRKQIQDLISSQEKEGREETLAPAKLAKTKAEAAKASAEAQNEPSKAFGTPVPLTVTGADGRPETVWARQDKSVPGPTPAYFRVGGPQAGQLIDNKTITGQQTPASANYPQYNENALNMLVGQALDGDPSVFKSMWGSPQLRAQITNAIGDGAVAKWGKENAGKNMAAVNAMFVSQEDALKGAARMRVNVGSYEEGMLKELDLAREYAHAGGLAGQVPVFNRWIQAGRVGIKGDPEVTKLNAAVESLANEFAKVMTAPGATGGAPTSDAARHQAHAIINGAMNLEGFDGALEAITRSAHNRVDAITDQMGRTIKDIQGGGGVSQPLSEPPATPKSAPAPKAPAAAAAPKSPAELPKEGMVRVYPDGSAWSVQGGKPVQLRPPQGQ